jgi:hypothetical protein
VRRRTHPSSDDGSALPLVLVAAALAGSGLVAVGRVGAAAADAARARTAADAVALGVLVGADPGALAAANGGRLVRVRRTGDAVERTVEVTVEVGEARATARARVVWDDGD